LKQVGALPALVLDPSDEVDRLSKSHSEMFRDRTCYGRTIAAHLPFRGIDPICRDPFIRSYSLSVFQKSIRVISELPCSTVLLHSFLPPSLPRFEAGNVLEELITTIKPYIAEAKRLGLSVLIENTFERYCDSFAKLVEQLDVHVVLDVPRIIEFSKDSPADWMNQLSHRVAGMHIYGTRGDDEHCVFSEQDEGWFRPALGDLGRKDLLFLIDASTEEIVPSANTLHQLLGNVEES